MDISFSRRYRGPLTSANGGWACGTLAAVVGGASVEVTLRLPPPLERPLSVRVDGERVLLLEGDALVAEAQAAEVGIDAPAPVGTVAAEAARERYVRGWSPDFRECFVCGTREEGDGLEIRVGVVAGREPLHAAPWTPHEATSAPLVWAALDCPGAFAVGAEGRGEVVLGRMACRVERAPERGEECVVASWPLGADGRKLFAGTALFAATGELLALARQTWISPRRSAA